MNPKLAEQYFERADGLVKAGKPEEALPLLGMLAEAFPDDRKVMFAQARTLGAMGRVAEAVALCDTIIERWDTARAKAYRESLLTGVLADTPPETRTSKGRHVTRLAILVIGILSIAGAAVYMQRLSQRDMSFEAPDADDIANAERSRKAAEFDRIQASYDETLARARGPVTEFMVEHPRDEWMLTAIDGMPDFKAGAYLEVPSIGEPERTLDIFLPLAYQNKPEAHFPAVIIQSAIENPGFQKLVPWAESREVILVTINSVHNGMWEHLIHAQDIALQTISDTLRVDDRLGFAMGMSGGAQASWRMICRYPDNFRGVVLMGMAVLHSCTAPTHVRMAYIHGEDEPNNWGQRGGIYYEIPVMIERGHDVRQITVPGAHVKGPPSARIEMIEWMVRETRREFGLEHPEHDVPEDAPSGRL